MNVIQVYRTWGVAITYHQACYKPQKNDLPFTVLRLKDTVSCACCQATIESGNIIERPNPGTIIVQQTLF